MFETALFISAFTTLFVIIDPPGCAPIFATLTKGTSRKHQQRMAFKSVGIAAIILIGFAYVGEWLFAKLGISLDALRIAGGIMLFIIGPVSYTHLRAHETLRYLVCRLLLEKKK